VGGEEEWRGEGEGVQSMHFIYLYRDRAMKFVVIILSRGEGE
jgi:hypothetical protein